MWNIVSNFVAFLENMNFKTMKNGVFHRGEIVLEAIENVVKFYEKCGFHTKGQPNGGLQPMIKEISLGAFFK